jgi:two-component system sensor histidine kinase BaeS
MEAFFEAQASALTLAPVEMPLSPLFDNLVKSFDQASCKKDVALKVEVDADIRVHADPERLTQILINLVSNALKATAAGGTITLRGKRTPASCTITVSDTGCGIADEELPLIFERFYRSQNGGLGLGLAIVRELMDAHGGTIEVASVLGTGTSFSLIFPDPAATPQFSTFAP